MRHFDILAARGISFFDASALRKEIKTYHILVCELANITRLNSEVLEGFRVVINDLVNVLDFDLLLGQHRPPEQLVEKHGGRLKNLAGDVDMPTLREDLLVDHIRDLGHGTLLGSVELIRLRGGAVVVKHQLERVAHVDGL